MVPWCSGLTCGPVKAEIAAERRKPRTACPNCGARVSQEMDLCPMCGVDLNRAVLDEAVKGARYAIAGLRPGWSKDELAACGEALWFEEQWVLLRSQDLLYFLSTGAAAVLLTVHLIDRRPQSS